MKKLKKEQITNKKKWATPKMEILSQKNTLTGLDDWTESGTSGALS